MTVLKVVEKAELEPDFWGEAGDLNVKSAAKEFTLRCDWPGCGEEFTAIQTPGFLRKAGWRYCGTGKQHLCPAHSGCSDEELEAAEAERGRKR